MSQPRADRRPARSRRRLKEALLALIQERGYDAISVRDITERADVGRSTFYAHFTSKDDLLFSGFDHWVASLATPRTSEASVAGGFCFSRPMLKHVRTQRKFFRAIMVDATDPGIRRRTIMTLASVVDRELTRMAGRSADRRTREAEARCIVGAWLGVAAWWLESAPGMSPEAIDAIFQRMVCPALPRGSQSSGG